MGPGQESGQLGLSWGDYIDALVAERGSLDGFDIALRTDNDGVAPSFADRGATWLLRSFPPVVELSKVFDVVVHGPPD